MRKYKYEVRSSEGAIVKGEMDAAKREDVVDALHGQGFVVVNVKEDVGISIEKLKEINIGGVPVADIVIFMRQFATMISAGLPLTQALRILKEQARNPRFKAALFDIQKNVEGGMGLSAALKRTKGIFDDITISLIAAGEESGNLDTVLQRLAVEMEKKKKLQDRIKSAFTYPLIMLVLVVGVVILMILVLIPAIRDIYDTFQAGDLPFITKAIIGLSDAVVNYWWLILSGIALAIVGFKAWYDTQKGRALFDKLVLKIPVFGKLIIDMQIAQFTRVLSLLLKSGLSILSSLKLTSEALSNTMFKSAVLNSVKEVEKGVPLMMPISRAEVFPLIVSQMIAVGEETGELDNVLQKMADFYEQEVEVTTANLSTLLEPFLLIFMGGAIGLIAAAVYLPMFNLASNFNM